MDDLQEEFWRVLVRADDAGRVVAIDSSAFVEDATGWVEIGAGRGDRYHHAQRNYLDGPLQDARGVCRYRLEGAAVAARSQEEMDGDAEGAAGVRDPAAMLAEVVARLDEQDAALCELAALLTGGGV